MTDGSAFEFEETTPRASARPANRRPPLRRSWGERILLTIGAVATAFCVLTATALAWALSWVTDKFEDIETVEIASVEQAAEGEPANWLLIGTDSREGIDDTSEGSEYFIGGDPSELPTGKRTDTMIVARVDPGGRTIDLLSIPRDLYVPIAGGGESRINAAFNAEGGEQRLVDTIEAYFGFEINHYAEVNFVGFQDIVDELGGVPMWFDRPMRDVNSGLMVENAGCQTLGGFQALAFARARNLEFFEDGAWRTDPTGDLGRTTRQQYFLRRVVDTAAAQVDLTSLGRINSLVDVGGDNLVIDGGVELNDLLSLAQTFSSVGSDRIVGHSLPVFDFRAPNNAAVLGMEVEAAQPILDIFRGLAPSGAADLPTADQPTGEVTTTSAPIRRVATVLNGSGVAGQAGTTSEALTAAGYEVVEVGNAAARTQTEVRYPSELTSAAAELISLLAADPAIVVDEEVESVVLITGSDFAGLAAEQRPLPSLAAPATTAPPTTAPAAEATTTTAVGVVPGPSPEGTACA